MFNLGRPNIEKLKAKGDIQGLIDALADKDKKVHVDAVHALASFGTRAVGPLGTALKHENPRVRMGTVSALASIPDTNAARSVVTALKDPDEGVRGCAQAMLLLADARTVETLIVTLKELDKDTRERAETVLGLLGSRAVEPLVAALKHEDRSVRTEVAWTLGTLLTAPHSLVREKMELIAALVAALADEFQGVRQNAAASLAKVGAAGTLAKKRDAGAVEALIAGLKDSLEPVRRQCALALGAIGDARAVEPLGIALQDESPRVREMAADALSQIGGDQAMKLLGRTSGISLGSLRNAVWQWSGDGFAGANPAWVDKVKQDNNSAIAWFSAQAFPPIPTFAGEKGEAEYCFNMALQAQNSGNVQEAWAGYHQALRRFCRLKDDKMTGLTCFNLGKVYGVRANWGMAQLMFLQSAYLTDGNPDEKPYAWSVFYLGDTCERLGDRASAREFTSLALNVFRRVSPADAPQIEKALSRLSEH